MAAFVPSYRVVEIYPDVCEPQMEYIAGRTGKRVWFPLNEDGFWAEPDAYSEGDVKVSSLMPRASAERAITCAKRINGENLLGIVSIEEREE